MNSIDTTLTFETEGVKYIGNDDGFEQRRPRNHEGEDSLPKLIAKSMSYKPSASLADRKIAPKGTWEVEAHGERDADGTESVGGSATINADNGFSTTVAGEADNQGNVSGAISISGEF